MQSPSPADSCLLHHLPGLPLNRRSHVLVCCVCALVGNSCVCFVSCPVAFFAQVGEVKKLAPGSLSDILKEVATDADKFTIQFPQDLKVSLALAAH